MSDEFVDPTELLQAEFERQMVELSHDYEVATSRRERSRVRRQVRRLRRHLLLGRLDNGAIVRW